MPKNGITGVDDGGGVSTVIGSLEAGGVEVMWLVVTGEGAVEVEGG